MFSLYSSKLHPFSNWRRLKVPSVRNICAQLCPFFLFFPGLHLLKLAIYGLSMNVINCTSLSEYWNEMLMTWQNINQPIVLRILLLLHSFHHIHNWHITIAPSSRQDLFSRVTWWMKINFAFSNTPTWPPSPSPLSSPWRPLSTWQTQQDGNQNISWGCNSALVQFFFSKYHILGIVFTSTSLSPLGCRATNFFWNNIFSFSFKSWLLWWKCGLVFFAQPLKITNYILPSHCHCRPKIFHSAAQTNCERELWWEPEQTVDCT